MSYASAFSPDYSSARARFRSSSIAAGCRLAAIRIDQDGPDGEPLTIDVAFLGALHPKRAVVISSGLHGIEGFFGSAVQAAMLEDVLGGWQPEPDMCLIFIHALNPYGMSWLRRVNEDNVDLNRNFLLEGEAYSGAPDGYTKLDSLLNPTSNPSRFEFFRLRALMAIAQHGMPALKETVAGGQYDFPDGVFFGGSGPSKTMEIMAKQMPLWLGSAEHVLHVDFHTGLGPWGTYKLFVDQEKGSERAGWLASRFGGDHVEPWDKEGTSYAIRGGFGAWCQAMLPHCKFDTLAAEFGTRQILSVIGALRAENRAHLHLDPDSLAYDAAKSNLKEIFGPADSGWRNTVVAGGIAIVQTAIEAIAE